MQEISLYFHVPFCQKKCPYCHFYVTADKESSKKDYMQALELEWQQIKENVKEKLIVSIYFGGGTPSLLPPEALAKILSWVKESEAAIAADCEITLEFNPDSADAAKLKAFCQIGINRASLGVQSLVDEELITLGRTHNSKKAIDTLFELQRAGFSNISCDLMYDLPSQTLKSWQKTLSFIQQLPITHLSFYNLTIEPNTPFYRQKSKLQKQLPDEEASLAMIAYAQESLAKAGFERYEISAYAKNGQISIHNTGYWRARPFLGLGPSAFSYWQGKRQRNICHLKNYCQALLAKNSPLDFSEELEASAKIKELLAIELRLLCGVHIPTFEEKWGALPNETRLQLEQLKKLNLLIQEKETFRLSNKGTLFYDSLAEMLI